MEDREMPRMHKYGETKTTRIMMATVHHVTSSSGFRIFHAAWFLLNRGYNMDWLHLAQDCGQCQFLMNTEMNL